MDKELCLKLIEWYEESIRLVKKKWFLFTAKDLLLKRKVCYGVCDASGHVFGVGIFADKWVHSKIDSIYYCGALPGDAKTKKEDVLVQSEVIICG